MWARVSPPFLRSYMGECLTEHRSLVYCSSFIRKQKGLRTAEVGIISACQVRGYLDDLVNFTHDGNHLVTNISDITTKLVPLYSRLHAPLNETNFIFPLPYVGALIYLSMSFTLWAIVTALQCRDWRIDNMDVSVLKLVLALLDLPNPLGKCVVHTVVIHRGHFHI